MRPCLALAALLAATMLAACGGHPTTVTATVTTTTTGPVTAPALPQVVEGCPVGKSYMGCSAPTLKTPPKLMLAPAPSGAKFPDVSSYQGTPTWSSAKASIAGAVAKLGEGSSIIDSSAAYNIGQFKSLHIPFAVYWFVRPDGCAAEGDEIEKAAKDIGGVPLIVLDEEVPGISGYAACLNPYVHAATGRNAVVYRSSGNDYDSSAPTLKCWVAAYGPSSAPACAGRTRVAWQYTDGRYGFPLYIPGIGEGDVSVDQGFLRLVAPQKPKPTRHYDWLPNTRRAFHVKGHVVHARERLAIQTWDRDKCRNPVKRRICLTARSHLGLLAGRISFIARHTGKHLKRTAKKPRWGSIHYRAGKHHTTLGGAYQQFVRRTSNKRHGVVTAW